MTTHKDLFWPYRHCLLFSNWDDRSPQKENGRGLHCHNGFNTANSRAVSDVSIRIPVQSPPDTDISCNCRPVRDLCYAVQYPSLQSTISLPALESLLLSYVPYLRDPISPFGAPSAESKAQVEKGIVKVKTVTKKGKTSEVEFDLNEPDKSFVLEISERLGIDEAESSVLYLRFKRDEAGILEDMAATAAATALQSSVLSKSAKPKPTRTQNIDTMRLFTQYYHQEVLKICDLLSALIRTASLNTEELDDMLVLDDGEEAELDVDARQARLKALAQNVLDEVVGESPASFIQTMFMNFAKAAQTPATMKFGKDNAKEW